MARVFILSSHVVSVPSLQLSDYHSLSILNPKMLPLFMLSVVSTLLQCSSLTSAWLPTSGKIRGVNLGSQFVVEPWMASDEWKSMGCDGDHPSEFDCVLKLGQSEANSAWATHWSTWTTQDDITEMQSYGLNTIRIPVGYWIREDIVYSDSEHFPQGGLRHLEQICRWASDAGMYIIIDLHGAPGAQMAGEADTGQVRINDYLPTMSSATVSLTCIA